MASPALSTIYSLWAAWVVSWLLAAVWSGRTAVRVSLSASAPYRLIQLIGVLMLFSKTTGGAQPDWLVSEPVRWAMAGLVALGFAFCWWARLHLGRLWSGSVERKEGHRVVDTGPYALVRHPIYTGLIASGYATAIALGAVVSLIGATVLVFGWYVKARLEETILREQLGQDAYAAYAARTPMLIPFLKF